MAKELTTRQQSSPTASRVEPYITLREAMDRLFQDSFIWPRGLIDREPFGTFGARPLDLYETDDDLYVKTALPGIKPEEVNIQVQGDQLIIDANMPEQKPEHVVYHYRGLVAGEFHQQVTLPVSVDVNQIEATFENGVLAVCLPKAEQVKPKRIQIKAASK